MNKNCTYYKSTECMIDISFIEMLCKRFDSHSTEF